MQIKFKVQLVIKVFQYVSRLNRIEYANEVIESMKRLKTWKFINKFVDPKFVFIHNVIKVEYNY